MIATLAEKARATLFPKRTRRAFERKFAPSGDTDVVLAWFADTCGATETTASTDPLEMAVAEGRRQVWLSLQDVLRVTEKDIRDAQDRMSRMQEDET